MITRRGFLSSAGSALASMTAGLTAARQAAAALAQHPEGSKMKITELETILIDNIDPPIGHRKWLFIQLKTDEGLVGLGERVSGGATNLKPQVELLNDLFDRFVKGESPFDVEKIWQRMKTTLHGQFSTAVALRVADILEEFDPFFFEEPVPPENVDEMARVAAHTSIPIATGERLVNMFEFAEVLEKQAAQIIQLDVGQCGGLLVAKKIAGMAETRYAMIAPHMYCGPVAASAAIQLDTCSPNFLIQEFNTNDLHSDIFVEPIKFENGFIEPPTGPGLGVELDMAVVERQRAA